MATAHAPSTTPAVHDVIRLRPYQVEVARAVLDSVRRGLGLTVTVEMARQAGKNELSASLELYLLGHMAAQGGDLVKAAPTFVPQAQISIHRLLHRLDASGLAKLHHLDKGYIVHVGRARALFLSAERSSHVVGQTASLLLEVDEAQDVSPEKFDKDFRPMAAAWNATTVLYGTAWRRDSLLEQVKQQNLEMERQDGVRRHFRYDWRAVAAHNPAYGSYVATERSRLGQQHPLFRTQYALEPLDGAGGLLSPELRTQLQGDHPRLQRPQPGRTYVAGLDVAGGPVNAVDLEWGGNPGRKRDSTVLTIGELAAGDDPTESRVLAVAHYRWTGIPHPRLTPQLADLLKNVWRVRRIAVDATGMGESLAASLHRSMGKIVDPVTFSAQTKSRLGFQFLSMIGTGRLKIYAGDGSDEWRELWRQVDNAEATMRPNQTMGFAVDPRRGHDDFLMSLALLAEAGSSVPALRQAHGRAPPP